jgi:hypothetical protein
MKHPSDTVVAPIRKQATDALRRARKLPVGPHRNDLRQLAIGLRQLEGSKQMCTRNPRFNAGSENPPGAEEDS